MYKYFEAINFVLRNFIFFFNFCFCEQLIEIHQKMHKIFYNYSKIITHLKNGNVEIIFVYIDNT